MNVLVLTNFYPPHAIGGYELGCRDVVGALERRGHRVRVLTSVHGVGRPRSEGDVHRWLPIDLAPERHSLPGFAYALAAAEVRGGRALARLLAEARPDVVHAWNLRYLPLSMVRFAQRRGLPVCYFVSDDWLAHWSSVDRWEQWTSHLPAHPLKRGLKQFLQRAVERACPAGRGGPLDIRHAQFASRYLEQACRREGTAVGQATVVHWGIDTRRFAFRENGRSDGRAAGPRLLYAGQIVPAKGVHTAIEACKHLVHRVGMDGLRLTIAGGSVQPHYRDRLQAMAHEAGLAEHVRFMGPRPREEMPAVYREHDILIFPSVWAEPFSLTLLEAMACGLAVVGTTTGGSGEILRHGDNALVFAPEDAEACARHVEALVAGPALYERMRRRARRTIEDDFELSRMVDAVEHDLERVAASVPRPS